MRQRLETISSKMRPLFQNIFPSKAREYEPLTGEDPDGHSPQRLPYKYSTRLAIIAAVTFGLLLFAKFSHRSFSGDITEGSKHTTPNILLPESIKHSWGPYSPYYSVSDYVFPPPGCEITQVNIRHGARFPTSRVGNLMSTTVAKLQSVPHYASPKLSFIKDYSYGLGVNDLIAFGAAEAFDSGQLTLERYSSLVNEDNIPFVRASSASRVILSATNWTKGFSHASNGRLNPSLDVILQESLNDTLDDHMCPNAGSGEIQADEWQAIYGTPIASSLNADAPGANLTASEVTNLIELCAFDTVHKETPSPFCTLFSQADFDAFEYYTDLEKFYNTGYGQELGRVQGVGYVNELLARLTGTPVRDNTQTNRTLDADPATFPLNRTIYADFSHDNEMAAIYAAIGLFRPARFLDPHYPDPRRTWISSRLFPFSGRLVTERLDCSGESFVRMFVNDALQTLDFCGAGKNGLCELDAFVDSQSYSRNDGEGDFEKCFS